MRRWGLAIGVAALAVVVACSSFSGGEDEDRPPVVEAGADGPASADAANAPASESSAPPPPFCKADGGTFCADFDDPGAVAFGGMTNIQDGGAATLDPSDPVSPPNAMRFSLERPPPDAGCTYVTMQSADVDLDTTGLGAEFKMKLAELPVASLAFGPTIRFEDPALDTRCNVYFRIGGGGATYAVFELDSTSGELLLARKPVPGQWSHVVLDVHGASPTRAISISIDGESAGEGLLPAACQKMTRYRGIAIGLYCVDDDVGRDIVLSYDDVRVIAR